MNVAPQVLKQAIAAVPAVKYAMGVAGLAAAVAIAVGLLEKPEVAVFGVLILFGMMFLLLVFSHAAKVKAQKHFLRLMLFLAWSYSILAVVVTVLLTVRFFFGTSISQAAPAEVTYRLAGRVTDTRGAPLPGVMITVDQHDFEDHTRSDGGFSHTVTTAPGSSLTVRATDDRHLPQSQIHTVSRTPRSLHFVLTPRP